LRCVFCQNEPLSSGVAGKAITIEHLAQIFCELAGQGAHNINLVTPTHYVPQIIAALALAREQNMALPVVYNTSGYETVATINALAGVVDIYLTDFKYASATLAARYSHAPDYPQMALAALEAMVEQVGEYALGFGGDGILQRGVIVRHLLLPGHLADAKTAVRRVFDTVGNRVCYSLMNQYTPMPQVQGFPALGRTVSEDEYNELINFALDLGIKHSFMQEGGTATESYIPPFDLTGVEG
jgi:putative pyruvate formate lyase activating enzyme